ncbi:NAD(P)/FAD-dependent oxidoreductase [Saccharopolyspora gregorii]|uniref:FAD-binding domain-containing protein n=2 Tax=Saccharopolyspora gregorii TaxID=33914 RepID=A0ABP6RLJ2_9PSEU
MDADVVVCGAGVGGLAAACALGARGFRVLLLEKMAEPSRVAKGEVLQPGALRVLREWGVAQRLESRGGLRLARLVARDTAGAPLMALDYDRLREQERWLLAHDYPVILEALADRLDGSVEFRRGVLVRDLLRDADGRVAGVRVAEGGQEREVRASLVVAADGISSRLRKSAGIPAHRDEYPHRLAAFDIADAPRVEQDFSAYVSERGLRLRYPLPGGRVRLYVQVGADELRGLDSDGMAGWIEHLVRDTPALEPLADALRASSANRQVLPVSRFLAPGLGVPGLALVGETGHSVHPMAAQGMNTSITDAESLARHVGGESSPAAVDAGIRSYEAERLPELVHIGRTSHNAARMITDLSWTGRVVGRRALRCTGGNDRLRYTVMHNMAGLGQHRLSLLDRLHQVGVLPDPRARRLPAWA